MQVIFVGTKNFEFFSRELIERFDKIILAAHSQALPS